MGKRRCRKRHRQCRKRSVATTQADASVPEARGGDAPAALLHVPCRYVRAVVRFQRMFCHRKQARGEEEHRHSREQQRAEQERVDRRRGYLVNAIERLKKWHRTGMNVWLTVDKLLRANEEGADVEAMADILRGFRAQRLARKLGCLGDERVTLAALEIGDRTRMRLCDGIERIGTVSDREQTKLGIRRWMETTLEGMFRGHSMAGDKEQVKLRIVR